MRATCLFMYFVFLTFLVLMFCYFLFQYNTTSREIFPSIIILNKNIEITCPIIVERLLICRKNRSARSTGAYIALAILSTCDAGSLSLLAASVNNYDKNIFHILLNLNTQYFSVNKVVNGLDDHDA